jgi:hypothetical protein
MFVNGAGFSIQHRSFREPGTFGQLPDRPMPLGPFLPQLFVKHLPLTSIFGIIFYILCLVCGAKKLSADTAVQARRAPDAEFTDFPKNFHLYVHKITCRVQEIGDQKNQAVEPRKHGEDYV